MEKRFKLSEKQLAALLETQQRLAGAKGAYEQALQQANTVGTLVSDAVGITAEDLEQLPVSEIISETRELVLKERADQPAAPAAKRRKKAVEA